MLGYIQAIEQHLVATHDSSSKAVGSSTAQVDTTQQQQRSVRHNSQRRQPAGFQAQGLVNVLWVLTVWGAAPSASWQTSCVAAANCLLGSCTMQGLSTLLWAMTRLQVGGWCHSYDPGCMAQTSMPHVAHLVGLSTLCADSLVGWIAAACEHTT